MKLLRKTWFKIIISLIGGGITAELLHISTGDPNRPMEFNPSLVFAVILYFAITFGIYLYDYYKIKSDNNLQPNPFNQEFLDIASEDADHVERKDRKIISVSFKLGKGSEANK